MLFILNKVSHKNAICFSSAVIPPRFNYNEKLPSANGAKPTRHRSTAVAADGVIAKPFDSRSNDLKPRTNETDVVEFPNQNTRPLDLRLKVETARVNEASKVAISGARRKSSSTCETPEVRTETNENKQDGAETKENDEPHSPTTLLWEKTVAEVKEHAIAKLQDELKKAHDELKLKDEEVARLSRFRLDVEQELEELTASLFQACSSFHKIIENKKGRLYTRFRHISIKT